MKLLLTIILLLFSRTIFAQQNDTIKQSLVQDTATWKGGIKGIVKDSTYRFVLSSATVALYNEADSTLLQFTIPNKFGEFAIHKLPLNTSLKLLITHIGYTPYVKTFRILPDKPLINFDTIRMHQNSDKENTIEEVTITALAPVRMNGDTIEFNPRAFKMDANATTEDLMRLLPGIVIWGDGDITYNGKKINSLMVDGKPFMGANDFTIATQNLPKDVLDKVQIYNQKDERNPLDSTLHANLKLKDEMKMGYFGKIGAGYGTNNRFAADGMLNGFNKKLQITTVGAVNNVNKSANSIQTLIKSNSYKGDNNSIDYQSDFTRPGINQGITAGSTFQYDFIADPTFRKSKRLNADYYYGKNHEIINSNRIVNTFLQADSILNNTNTTDREVRNENNNLTAKYTQEDQNYSLSFSTNASINRSNNVWERIGESNRTGVSGILSSNNSLDRDENTQRKWSFSSIFVQRKNSLTRNYIENKKHSPFDNFTLNYQFYFEENDGNSFNYSQVKSNINPDLNNFFDRSYEKYNQKTSHTFDLSYPDFKKLIFGNNYLWGVNVELLTKINISNGTFENLVQDKDSITMQKNVNTYLTNVRDEYTQDWRTFLSISKYFYKGLTNRYMKNFNINITPGIQQFKQDSRSDQEVQNFNYVYRKFIPNASINYNNHQYGSYELGSSINYSTNINYPTVYNLAPLVDSTNVWYIPKGNLNIRPEYIQTWQWKASLQSRKPKNPYQLNLVLDYNTTHDKISDSIFYDNVGRRINYNINMEGNYFWHVGSNIRKSYSPNKNHTFRFYTSYDRYNYNTPQYVNAELVTSKNANNNISIEIAYSYLNILNLSAKQVINLYENRQTNSQKYQGVNNNTLFTGSWNFPKKITWATNINFNSNRADNQPSVNYAIWNANVTYRFMKGNQGEIKFSALDLLNQNRSVINNTNRNIQTFGYNNVLRQYFMLSLAYYPRKFGK